MPVKGFRPGAPLPATINYRNWRPERRRYSVKLSPPNKDERTDMSKIATTLVSLYDWLSRPALSERERMQRQIAEPRNNVRSYACFG